MEFALWSRAAVMQLIEREYGITLSIRGVGNYLARWGFTPQKPIKKAYEQRPEAVIGGASATVIDPSPSRAIRLRKGLVAAECSPLQEIARWSEPRGAAARGTRQESRP